MIEYGLSVSLNGTPRTPVTPRGNSPEGCEFCYTPGRRRSRKMNFGDLVMVVDGDREKEEEGSEYESISPRVCFSEMVRRLDFTMESAELSPVPFSSVSVSVSRNNGAGAVPGGEDEDDACCSGGRGGLLQEQQEPSIGDCTVCYQPLQERRNHVFTLCGHLFCVQCLLKWWDTSSTCPLCRAELLNVEDDDDDDTEDIDSELDAALDAALGHADADADADAVEGRDAWMRPPPDYEIERIQIQPQANLNDRVYIGSSDSSDHGESDTGDSIDLHIRNTSLINRYRFQDSEWRWSFHCASIETSPNYDDTVYPLSQADIDGLRENREIATTLFARMRFRETMFQPDVQFLGEVWSGSWIPKSEWIDIMRHHQPVTYSESDDAIQTIMYEFVIRRGSNISPYHEVNIFGFIKDVAIQQTVEYDEHTGEEISRDRMDYDWENIVEYTFVAEVFTPTDFYIHGDWSDPNQCRSYGGYNMTDGTITTQQVMIPFSQIRRLYRMNGHERWYA
jgi:hypothetical protein